MLKSFPMKTQKLLFLIISLLPSAAFSQKDTVPKSIKTPVEVPDPKDLKAKPQAVKGIDDKQIQFVNTIYNAGLFEERLSEQAKNKAKHNEVKDFAELVNKEQAAMDAELVTLSAKKQVTLPDTLLNAQRDTLNNLIKKTGKEYDTAFLT